MTRTSRTLFGTAAVAIGVVLGAFAGVAGAQTPAEGTETERREAMLREAGRRQAERLDVERRMIEGVRIKPPFGRLLFRGPDGIYESGKDSKLRLVFPLPPREWNNDWLLSPDRQKAALGTAGYVDAPGVPFIEFLERGQSTPRRVVTDVAIPKELAGKATRGYDANVNVGGWSPDGRWLVVTTQFRTKGTNESVMRLVRMTGAGEDPRIFCEARSIFFYGWSPDGTCIAYGEDTPGGQSNALIVARADGTVVHRFPNDRYKRFVGWTPDGRVTFEESLLIEGADPKHSAQFATGTRLYYAKVSIASVDGTRTEELAVGPCNLTAFVWSPDGQRFAFLRDTACFGGGSDSYYEIVISDLKRSSAFTFPPTGGQTWHDSPVLWSPDGKYLLIFGNQGIRIVSFDGRHGRISPSWFVPIAWVP